MKTHLAVIGAGPGGYVAAFHAADLGMQVTLIDTEQQDSGIVFTKGASGNPERRFGQVTGNPTDRGGRPQSLAAHVREQVGDNAEAIVQRLIAIMNQRGSAWGRVQACRELLDRGWGRAAASVTVHTSQIEPVANLKVATDDELKQVEEIMLRWQQRARDAEKTPAPLTAGQRDPGGAIEENERR